METQRQPKDSNWYNNRLVLILMFLALYVIIPVLLVIFKDKICDDCIPFSTIILVLLGIASIWVLLIVCKVIKNIWRPRSLLKSAIKDAIKMEPNIFLYDAIKDAVAINQTDSIRAFAEIKPAIVQSLSNNQALKDAIKNAMNSEMVKDAISKILKDNLEVENEVKAAIVSDANNVEAVKSAITNAFIKNGTVAKVIKDALDADSLNNAIRDALNADVVTNALKKASNNIVSSALTEGVTDITKAAIDETLLRKGPESAFEKSLKEAVGAFINEDIQRINACIESALRKEQEAQKYRFAERVVAEICKNNRIDADAIASVKCLIDDIINHKGISVVASEDASKFSFIIIDVNGKKLVFSIYKGSYIMEVTSPNDTYVLCNGCIITIEDKKITKIEKSVK